MKNASRLLGVASATVLATLGANAAHAAGTVAGTTITNTASVGYSVGGVAQTAQTASNNVVVDRKVIFTVTGAAATTSVVPGQTGAVTVFTLTNSSNDTLDFGLAAAQQAGGAAAHGGTDVFDTGAYTFYSDAALTQVITYVDELAPDSSKTIYVASNVPITATNTQVSGVILTATAEAGGASGTQGAVLTNTAGANTAGVDTVLADGAGATDIAGDGKYSAKGDYTVSAPVLTVQKLSTIISDPIDGTTNPKAIPGAVIEYCIVVSNAAGGATATGVSVSDPLPATVTYAASPGLYLNGTFNGTTCNSDGTLNASYVPTGSTVSGTRNNVAASGSTTMRFRVTIN